MHGTSQLRATALELQKNIEKYIERLITAIGGRSLDISEYLDRLERLNSFSQKTAVAEFIDIALLTLKSAKGFYYRLIDDEGRRYQHDESYKNYRGRALENKLEEKYGSLTESKIFNSINELLQMEAKTGQQQQNFIEKLTYLFAVDKHLYQRLQTNKQRILQSEGYPQNFDVQRSLYRYELQVTVKENQSLVIEFNKEPVNVAFIYTSDKELKSTSLTPLKQKSRQENINDKRYVLPLFNTESYLFVAAPKNIISHVELIKN